MIYLGADHRGYNLKEKMKNWLEEWGYQFEDCGAFELNAEDDYPDFVRVVAEKISKGLPDSRGIVLGATGQGEAIVANRFQNVRAAVYYGGSHDIIKLSREHNDANILSLGASFVDNETIKQVIKIWLTTSFSNTDRHVRRLKKLNSILN